MSNPTLPRTPTTNIRPNRPTVEILAEELRELIKTCIENQDPPQSVSTEDRDRYIEWHQGEGGRGE